MAGNSLGGAIALELARRDLVASATGLAPIGFWSDAEARYAGLTLRALQRMARAARPLAPRLLAHPTVRRLLLAAVVAQPARVAPEVAAADAAAFADAQSMAAIVPYTTRYRFRRGEELHVPVTVAWGDHDRLLPARQARRAQALLPKARHIALPGAGQVAMSDVPDLVADTLLTASTTPAGL